MASARAKSTTSSYDRGNPSELLHESDLTTPKLQLFSRLRQKAVRDVVSIVVTVLSRDRASAYANSLSRRENILSSSTSALEFRRTIRNTNHLRHAS